MLFMGTWIFLGVPWCVEGSEHGLHGLHGFFSGDLRIPLGAVVCEGLELGLCGF